MTDSTITHFAPDFVLLSVFQECIDSYDIGDPNAEWPNNILSRKLVVYGSGVIARDGEPVRHNVDPDELANCKRLAEDVHTLMKDVAVGMGSESGATFSPLFITANVDDTAPDSIDEALIRSKFGGTIFPPTTITVESLKEEGTWWSEVLRDASVPEEDREALKEYGIEVVEPEVYLRPWRALVQWFHEQPAFKDSAFVRIGDYDALHDLEKNQWPKGTEIVPCVLPRLALGLTTQGSLVGLFGFSVQT
jgi:hypothetical protein